MSATVVLVGTFDTKGVEYDFVRKQIDDIGTCSVFLIDVGLQSSTKTLPVADISSISIIKAAGGDYKALEEHKIEKAEAFSLMTKGLTLKLNELYQSNRLHGLLALGGSCGTAIVSEAIQQSKVLPIGLPKLIVSTVAASSNAHTAVGLSDVTLMHSVTDISGGINRINEPILANAAAAIAAMASRYYSSMTQSKEATFDNAPLIALTMFGVTTPCVMEAKKQLDELGYNTVIFHATGIGGQAMERLIESGSINGVLDITTTELADELVGGILSAGPERLEIAGRKGLPQVVSLGALDMVNFGPRHTVPKHFAENRLLYEHNAQVTLMRTTSDECTRLGEIIAQKLNQHQGSNRVCVFVPRGGFSLISVDGGPFCDKQADTCLIEALRKHADTTKVEIIERKESINDPSFAHAMVQALHAQMQYKPVRKLHTELVQKQMTKPRNRRECLDRLKSVVDEGRIIIGSGAGIGLSAKCIEEGGADLLIIYNSGRFRMAGRGSCAGLLSYSDANAIVLEMAGEVLPVVKYTPVLAGVCGTDPFRLMPQLLKQIKEAGFIGIQNFPTVGIIDGRFRQSLEETGMAYEQEVEMIRHAHLIGLVTAPYVFNEDEARKMTEAGADIIVAHMGVTTKGAIGAKSSLTLDECVQRIQAIHDVCIKINPQVIVLCHGGPLAEPNDVQYILARTHGIKGFFGASSMERLPTEIALVENTKRFKQLKLINKD
ncbi:unnamed protein product [Rotaria sp. Silwood1]|nr:unnamed protein product [Rotaria sp. Silwood1]CAF3773181.1 unnamed protein product [Rotaria sp. Silwood1]CAF4580242.1 unnamed protein product [Rotaria sp. Silwood1]CAF4633295.1 unnamed protein product [Rotaria sp. Silwood1]